MDTPAPRLLLIEDSPTQAAAVSAVLEGAGYEVAWAHDGESGWAKAQTGGFDVVLSDVLMPGISGYELCRRIKDTPALARTPVVLFTRLVDPSDLLRALECGADQFVPKASAPEHLLRRLESALGRGAGDRALEARLSAVIGAGRAQMVGLLVSSAEELARTNRALEASRAALAEANAKLEGRVRSSEEKYRSLMEHAADGIVLLDAGGRVREANARAGELLGESPPALVGVSLRARVPPEERGYVDLVLGRLSTQRQASASRVHALHPGGGRTIVDLTASAVTVEGEPASLVIIRDVTEQAELARRAAQSEKLASIGALAAGVGHEINTPAGSVLAGMEAAKRALEGLREALERGNGEGARGALEELQGVLERATEGAERIRGIAGDLRVLARADEGEPARVPVAQCLDSAINVVQHELRGRATVERDYEPGLPSVLAHPGRLGQVFVNLLVNAAQSLDEGAAARNVVRVSARREGARVRVDVQDTGRGIAPEVLPRIFEPFFTTRPAGVGTGLGLSISQDLVRRMGGEIQVRSEPGRGTTVSVLLALPEEARVRKPAVPAPAPGARGAVLLVDDDPNFLWTYQSLLRRDHDVTTALGGRAALDLLESPEARFSVIVCDLSMPDVDGVDLHRYAQEKRPDLADRMIFITGGAFTERASRFLENTTRPHLEKPFRPEVLRGLIATLLGPSQPAPG